jgi:hypothetical protein
MTSLASLTSLFTGFFSRWLPTKFAGCFTCRLCKPVNRQIGEMAVQPANRQTGNQRSWQEINRQIFLNTKSIRKVFYKKI